MAEDQNKLLRELITTVKSVNKSELEADHNNLMQSLRVAQENDKAARSHRFKAGAYFVLTGLMARKREIAANKEAQFQRLKETKVQEADARAEKRTAIKQFSILETNVKFQKRTARLIEALVKLTPKKDVQRRNKLIDDIRHKEMKEEQRNTRKGIRGAINRLADSLKAFLGDAISGALRILNPFNFIENLRRAFIRLEFFFRFLGKLLGAAGLVFLTYRAISGAGSIKEFATKFTESVKEFFKDPFGNLTLAFNNLTTFFKEFDFKQFFIDLKDTLKTVKNALFTKEGRQKIIDDIQADIEGFLFKKLKLRTDLGLTLGEALLVKTMEQFEIFFKGVGTQLAIGLNQLAPRIIDSIFGTNYLGTRLKQQASGEGIEANVMFGEILRTFTNPDGTVNENAPALQKALARKEGNFKTIAQYAAGQRKLGTALGNLRAEQAEFRGALVGGNLVVQQQAAQELQAVLDLYENQVRQDAGSGRAAPSVVRNNPVINNITNVLTTYHENRNAGNVRNGQAATVH